MLSRLSSYYLVPVIDIGILLSSDAADTLTGIDGRITVLSPGSACLLCRGRVDLARAAAEMKTPEERNRLADEGYAPALAEVEPAVVTFTTMAASFAVSELLERLIGYGDSPRPSEVLLRIHDRAISTNEASPSSGALLRSGCRQAGVGRRGAVSGAGLGGGAGMTDLLARCGERLRRLRRTATGWLVPRPWTLAGICRRGRRGSGPDSPSAGPSWSGCHRNGNGWSSIVRVVRDTGSS